jgi:hypothetical protein
MLVVERDLNRCFDMVLTCVMKQQQQYVTIAIAFASIVA